MTGSVEVYERDGKYQLYAREIELDGAGNLYLKFEALKKELEEMGMFAPEYKKRIPTYIRRLGIVTAPTGAAVQDIRNISARRNPYVQLILYPALVQGEGAVSSIVNGIRALDALGVDVIIVGRGGGSIEDLWAFNEEEVARAIFECETPVISAVGHQTDTTIADFVADLRAPTPSAAAELAVFDHQAAVAEISAKTARMNRALQQKLDIAKLKVNQYQTKLQYVSPESRLHEHRRVNAIVNELRGEKIDIINWSDNPAILIENALSPAKVISVMADPDEKTASVIVPDYQLSLAIGKEGQNARLAARLTGYKIRRLFRLPKP